MSSSPGCGPSAIATATARFSSTTGDGLSSASRPYSSAICSQSTRLLAVERRDRRLELVRAGRRSGERAVERAAALLDLVRVPEAAVLLVEQHELAGRRDPRVAARVLQEQQRVQAVRLGLVRHQRREHSGEPDRLRAQLPRARAARSRR